MNWSEVPNKVLELYQQVATWSFEHQVETDLLIVGVALGGLITVLRKQRQSRRTLHRVLWGRLMSRQERERYQILKFEDALTDAAMEMVFKGDMNDEEEKHWYRFFAEKCELNGLRPQKNVKSGIRLRLKMRFGLKPIYIPGEKPGVTLDPSYDPVKPIAEGLTSSKYNGG